MAPKPFPFPLGIGVDITQASRVVKMMKTEDIFNRWSRKVFNRLEWPHLFQKFNLALGKPSDWQKHSTDVKLNLPYVFGLELVDPLRSNKKFLKLGQFLAGRSSPEKIPFLPKALAEFSQKH